ncbi:MAG: SDR family oxidoreductase [Rhizobacter sp.]|nr:SDR family oxidoreductase [Chlorobiales bacterium]
MASKKNTSVQPETPEAAGGGRLAGKRCLITGGAGNIGAHLTRRFLAEGATCIITGRNKEKLETFKSSLLSNGLSHLTAALHTRAFDGSKPEDVHLAVADLQKEFGELDVLVNNAGSVGPKQILPNLPFAAEQLEALRAQGVADTETVSDAVQNLLGISWLMTRAAFGMMKHGGSIINVSTIFSRTPYFGRTAYSVPKSALNSLSLHLARELGTSKKAIRLNTVFPGPIDSERIRNVFGAMDKLKSQPAGATAQHFFDTMILNRRDEPGGEAGIDSDAVAVKQFPKPEDVVGTILFLASDDSKAFAGHGFAVTNGMQIDAESRTTLTSRPRLRISDGTDKRTLIIAGDQISDAIAFANRFIETKSSVILVFQHPVFYERAKENYPHLDIRHFSAADEVSKASFFATLASEPQPVENVLILPRCEKNFQNAYVLDTSDDLATKFLDQEITGTISIASALSKFFAATEHKLRETPRVVFVSAPAYGLSVYHDILRSANEELIRIWRDESETAQRNGERKFGLVAHQLLRYSNRDENNFDLASGFVLEVLNTSKQLEAINVYLPAHLEQPAKTGLIDSLYGMHLGKVAVITGGSQGIGGEIGRMLAAAGARVVLSARRKSELEEKRNQILIDLRRIGYSRPEERVVILDGIDVADESSLGKLTEFSLKNFGRIDYLINNAGISGAEQMVVDMSVKDWRHTLQSNMISNFSLMRKVLPSMKKQGFGHILNISSYFGGEKYVAVPYPNRADYAVSKAGQRAMAESFAKFLGPEILINAIAPGPVDGIRLQGTAERPGLFDRRGRLILATKRLNDLYASAIKAMDEGARVSDILAAMQHNSIDEILNAATVHQRITNLAHHIHKTADSLSHSYTHLMDRSIAEKLILRLRTGCYLEGAGIAESFLENLPLPPEPFFTYDQLRREAKKINDGILSMLYLKRMPTESDVALSTVHYLATDNISGETFHPSGGLRFDRTVPEGELFGKPKPERLAAFEGKTIFIFGDYLIDEISALVSAYIGEYRVLQIVVLTKSTYAAEQLQRKFGEYVKAARLHVKAIGMQLEEAIDEAVKNFGRPEAVISMPFEPIVIKQIVATKNGSWENVFNEKDFEDLVENQLTYHFRIARKCSLLGELQLVLVTPKTSQQSTAEEFALANFIKTALHSLTATLGVENERCVHHSAVNQVDLTRRAKSEKPQTPEEIAEELDRFVIACLLTSAPLPSPDDSRYRSRIYRGNAITV